MANSHEELANCISHGIGLLAVLGATLFVLINPHIFSRQATSLLIFTLSAAPVYLASTIFHALPQGRAKQLLLKIDCSSIFIFIAGSYTAFATHNSAGMINWPLLLLIWGLAIAGVLIKLFEKSACAVRAAIFYLAIGWLTMIAAVPLLPNLSHSVTFWLIAGGLIYSIGTIFYVVGTKMPFSHLGWHLFVMLGTGCHYAALTY